MMVLPGSCLYCFAIFARRDQKWPRKTEQRNKWQLRA
jgi:hypothetical protein